MASQSAHESKVYTKEMRLQLDESVKIMFKNIEEQLKSEMLYSNEDFKLLEAMNETVKDKYVEMSGVTRDLSRFMQDLQEKYKNIDPYVRKIEQVDNSVTELEQTVGILDEYTRRLEEKYKKLVLQRQLAKAAPKE